MAESSHNFGSYNVADSDTFHRIGEARGVLTPQRIRPQLSMGRAVNRSNSDSNIVLKDSWHDYLDEVGAKNYNRGKAKAYGSIVVTFVTANEAGRMLAKKHPDLYEGSTLVNRRLFQILNRIKRDYHDFVRDNSFQEAQVQAQAANGSDLLFDRERSERKWIDGIFNVGQSPEPFGKCDVSLVFARDHEEILTEEMEATWGFWKEEGYDVSLVDRRRRPHMSVFDAFASLSEVAVRGADVPTRVALHPPKAFYNENKPYRS